MQETRRRHLLSALAQPVRLRIFRSLVVAGPEELTPGVLAQSLDVPATALSFHLKELAHANLVSRTPRPKPDLPRGLRPRQTRC